jgi:hypothetical protein
VAVGIVEAGAHNGGFEIVVAYDPRDPTDVAKRPLVQPQERLELLIPDRFLVAMPRMAERQAKDPRPTPLAGRRIERRRSAEEIDLSLGSGGAVKDPDRAALRRDGAHEALHRFVAGAVAVLLDEVLPDPLQAETGVELLGDRRPIYGGGKPRARRRAGERCGRFWVGAGERFGRF